MSRGGVARGDGSSPEGRSEERLSPAQWSFSEQAGLDWTGLEKPPPGPALTYRLNGVPLRRVSQAYVIATSTKVELGSISIPESVNDAYFAKSKAAKGSKEGEFFGEGKEKKAFPEEKKSEQKVRLAKILGRFGGPGHAGGVFGRRGRRTQTHAASCETPLSPVPGVPCR